MMIPNDMFAEFVTSGSLLDPLDSDDMAGIITGTCGAMAPPPQAQN
jgi:hypothetical protein